MASGVYIDTVPVGNPGNDNDSSGYGALGYTYRMGKYEVTAGQYTEFLNAVAKTDTYRLYNDSMDLGAGCGISWGADEQGRIYSVSSQRANRPVNYVSWGDAARFANWLTNGQPTGPQGPATTEDGSYLLNGATSAAELLAVTRKPDARYVLPSEDEWYKAAYHLNDGVTGNYWDYPTSTNSIPSNVLSNPDPDPGNNANFYDVMKGDTIGSPYHRTPVGDFENSESPYATFDQGGNVWEWNEAVLGGSSRGQRGGAWNSWSVGELGAGYRYQYDPTFEDHDLGFRVAMVPEPATLSLLVLGGLALIRRKRH